MLFRSDALLAKIDSLIISNVGLSTSLFKLIDKRATETKPVEDKPITIVSQIDQNNNQINKIPTVGSTKEININLLATELNEIKNILRDTLNIDREISSNTREFIKKETNISLDGTKLGTAFSVTSYKTQ